MTPDRDVDLGMQHVLRVQLLHHAIGDELVVVGGAQPLGHGFEGQQKSGEVLVLVQSARASSSVKTRPLSAILV